MCLKQCIGFTIAKKLADLFSIKKKTPDLLSNFFALQVFRIEILISRFPKASPFHFAGINFRTKFYKLFHIPEDVLHKIYLIHEYN